MEAVSSSGTLVSSYRTTGPNIPEDSHLHANKVSNEGTNELPKSGVGNLFMLEGRINLAVIK
jgi:hypothetical protein